MILVSVMRYDDTTWELRRYEKKRFGRLKYTHRGGLSNDDLSPSAVQKFYDKPRPDCKVGGPPSGGTAA